MKELSLDEITLLDEMKSNCLKKGQYIDKMKQCFENIKKDFEALEEEKMMLELISNYYIELTEIFYGLEELRKLRKDLEVGDKE